MCVERQWAEEIAAAVAVRPSERSSSTTGHTLLVDGRGRVLGDVAVANRRRFGSTLPGFVQLGLTYSAWRLCSAAARKNTQAMATLAPISGSMASTRRITVSNIRPPTNSSQAIKRNAG